MEGAGWRAEEAMWAARAEQMEVVGPPADPEETSAAGEKAAVRKAEASVGRTADEVQTVVGMMVGGATRASRQGAATEEATATPP